MCLEYDRLRGPHAAGQGGLVDERAPEMCTGKPRAVLSLQGLQAARRGVPVPSGDRVCERALADDLLRAWFHVRVHRDENVR